MCICDLAFKKVLHPGGGWISQSFKYVAVAMNGMIDATVALFYKSKEFWQERFVYFMLLCEFKNVESLVLY